MTALRTLLLVLTAMIFAFGGLARAETPTAEPPCHEAPAQHPGKATLAMSCCIGCMPAPNLLPAPLCASKSAAPATYAPVSPTLMGRPLAPETPPPRA